MEKINSIEEGSQKILDARCMQVETFINCIIKKYPDIDFSEIVLRQKNNFSDGMLTLDFWVEKRNVTNS